MDSFEILWYFLGGNLVSEKKYFILGKILKWSRRDRDWGKEVIEMFD